MATRQKYVIFVDESRRHVTIRGRAHGKFAGLYFPGYTVTLLNQPLPPTTSNKAFWTQILTAVQNALT